MIPWRFRKAIKPLQFKLGLMLLNPMHPSPSALQWLHSGWSNEGWSGDTAYLEEVWRRSLNARRILECGSGLSTILMGAVASKTGAEVWSLEHISQWRDKVSDILAKNGAKNSRVVYAPLKSYGDFEWYTLPSDIPNDFDLVVCDGPPSATVGGRYGLVPVCRELLSKATILLDDAERVEEQAIAKRWEDEFGMRCQYKTNADGAFAVLDQLGVRS
jgi:hypothetical protein